MALAQEVLKNLGSHDERALTVDMIQKAVADYYQFKPVDLRSRNNSKSVAMPRQIAMFLCKTLTSASLPEIGRVLRRQAPLDGHSLHPEGRNAAAEGPGFQQGYQHADRVVPMTPWAWASHLGWLRPAGSERVFHVRPAMHTPLWTTCACPEAVHRIGGFTHDPHPGCQQESRAQILQPKRFRGCFSALFNSPSIPV